MKINGFVKLFQVFSLRYCILISLPYNCLYFYNKDREMHYILYYDYVENIVEKRAPFREEHLNNAKEHQDKGLLKMAGAYANPVDGAVFIFKTEDKSIVESFAKNDPYVKNGLVPNWSIREWTVVIGS